MGQVRRSGLIQFAKNLVVTASGRGYVTARVRGTGVYVCKTMDPDLKERLTKLAYEDHIEPWQKAMKDLEKRAIAEAKEKFAASRTKLGK